MIIEIAEGNPFYGLLEDEGPEEGQVVCELSEEEFHEASRLGNRCISMSVHQSVA